MPTDVAPNTVKARVLGWLLAQLTRLFYVTSRKRYHNKALLDAHFASGQRFIMVAWHNRNIVGPMGYVAHAPRGRVFRPLASASRDGTLAAMTMHYLGVDCIRGSSSRGGTQALREMLRAAKAGADLGITPDGPRGPVYQVQAGVVAAARMTGLPIIAMSYHAARHKRLRSWDRMIVPAPFTTLAFGWAGPFTVAKGADEAAMDATRAQVEQALLQLNDTVAELAGTPPD
jgi:lysophospholipid acyltransferase (LPLAT)-like uncharacterized protein